MAVDSRDKRGSALRHQSPGLHLFPNPDGSLATAADRQFIGWIYSGIAAASSVVQWEYMPRIDIACGTTSRMQLIGGTTKRVDM